MKRAPVGGLLCPVCDRPGWVKETVTTNGVHLITIGHPDGVCYLGEADSRALIEGWPDAPEQHPALSWTQVPHHIPDDTRVYGKPRDPLAELIADLRAPLAGPGGMSSRSIADAIRARWDMTEREADRG